MNAETKITLITVVAMLYIVGSLTFIGYRLFSPKDDLNGYMPNSSYCHSEITVKTLYTAD